MAYIKKLAHNAVILTGLTVVFGACSMDNSETPQATVYIDYGVIWSMDDSGYFEIRGDKNQLFKVVEYGTPDYQVTEGERVKFNYIIQSSDPENKVYSIKVNGFDNIVSHPVLPRSFMEEIIGDEETIRLDSLGHDGIRVSEIVFSGKYINLNYEILVPAEDSGPRIINMVYDDEVRDTLILTLYHNAYGVVPGMGIELSSSAGNAASFEIASLNKGRLKEIPVIVRWCWYGIQADELIEEAWEGTYVVPDWVY